MITNVKILEWHIDSSFPSAETSLPQLSKTPTDTTISWLHRETTWTCHVNSCLPASIDLHHVKYVFLPRSQTHSSSTYSFQVHLWPCQSVRVQTIDYTWLEDSISRKWPSLMIISCIPYICFLQCSMTLESWQVICAGKKKSIDLIITGNSDGILIIIVVIFKYLGRNLPFLKITNIIWHDSCTGCRCFLKWKRCKWCIQKILGNWSGV